MIKLLLEFDLLMKLFVTRDFTDEFVSITRVFIVFNLAIVVVAIYTYIYISIFFNVIKDCINAIPNKYICYR